MPAAVLERPIDGGEEPRPPHRGGSMPAAQRIERAGLDQALQHALVDEPQIGVLAERVERIDPAELPANASIDSTAPSPTFLTAQSPNRTPSLTTENGSSLELMSGGRIGTPSSRHSPRYIASLSVLAASIVSSAATKCRG